MFIKLFRRINRGSLRNYFMYAIGEIVLIVIGILIVVEIDKWKQASSDREREINILKEILEGFRGDIGDLNFNIWVHEGAAKSGRIVLNHFERNLPYHDSLSHHFARSLAFSRMVVNEGPYEHLKSIGFNAITNNMLRTRIVSMYDYEFEGMRLFETNTFVDESNAADILQTRFDKTEIWQAVDEANFFPGTMIPNDFAALREDPIYKHFLKSRISKNEFYANFFVRPPLVRLIDLAKEIDVEIRALEGSE
jgi:hypothetical protein